MKFYKVYEKYMKQLGKPLPGIGYKQHKKNIKQCSSVIQFQLDDTNTPGCSVCEGTFFPSLFEEMSAVVNYFNVETRKLVDPPISLRWAFWIYSYFDCGWRGRKDHHDVLVKEAEDLLMYAIINVIAFRKILNKYDKVHKCEKSREIKSSAQVKHIEIILQSPWFYELMAFRINLRDRNSLVTNGDITTFQGLALKVNDDNSSISCGLFDYIKTEVNLFCPICLDIVFDPVALGCGHILCYMCACSSASVNIVDGLKAAALKKKCPLCREARVYPDAIRLEKLNVMLSRRYPEYWRKRRESERKERLQQVKEHWQSQVHGLMAA